MRGADRSLFRAEAVAHHEAGLGPGSLVRHSAWVRWGYWIVLLAVVAAAAAAVLIRVTPTESLAVLLYRGLVGG